MVVCSSAFFPLRHPFCSGFFGSCAWPRREMSLTCTISAASQHYEIEVIILQFQIELLVELNRSQSSLCSLKPPLDPEWTSHASPKQTHLVWTLSAKNPSGEKVAGFHCFPRRLPISPWRNTYSSRCHRTWGGTFQRVAQRLGRGTDDLGPPRCKVRQGCGKCIRASYLNPRLLQKLSER